MMNNRGTCSEKNIYINIRAMSYELGFAVFYVFIYLSIIIVTVFNYVCVSAFEQGHLDSWRFKVL